MPSADSFFVFTDILSSFMQRKRDRGSPVIGECPNKKFELRTPRELPNDRIYFFWSTQPDEFWSFLLWWHHFLKYLSIDDLLRGWEDLPLPHRRRVFGKAELRKQRLPSIGTSLNHGEMGSRDNNTKTKYSSAIIERGFCQIFSWDGWAPLNHDRDRDQVV